MFLLKGVAVIFVQAFVCVVWVVFFVRVFDVVVVVVVVVAVGVMVLVVVVVAVVVVAVAVTVAGGCWLLLGGWRLAVGGWRLAVGGWWLVIGDWWLVGSRLLAASFVAAAVGLMRHCSVFGPPCYTSCWYCWCSCDC